MDGFDQGASDGDPHSASGAVGLRRPGSVVLHVSWQVPGLLVQSRTSVGQFEAFVLGGVLGAGQDHRGAVGCCLSPGSDVEVCRPDPAGQGCEENLRSERDSPEKRSL